MVRQDREYRPSSQRVRLTLRVSNFDLASSPQKIPVPRFGQLRNVFPDKNIPSISDRMLVEICHTACAELVASSHEG